jgi:AcrR family transcriptional regulator
MTIDAAEPRLRADAERNRRRLLDAAAAAFAEKGVGCSVDEIARRAGVGHATAFRHFPTKEGLVAAVVKDRLRQIADMAEAALEQGDADASLRVFLEQTAEMHANDRCLVEEARFVARDPEVLAEKAQTMDAVGRLVARAQAAGALRSDVTANDVFLLVRGVIEATAPLHAVSPELWRRYLAIVLDGLRAGSGAPLPLEAPVGKAPVHAVSDPAA